MEQLVAQSPGDLRFWQGLARIAAESAELKKATNSYKKILELDPNAADARYSLAQIYAEAGLITDALSEYDRAQKTDTSGKTDLIVWAKCLANKGRWEEAWEKLNTLLNENPMQDSAYAILYEVGHKVNKLEKTEELFRRRDKMAQMYPSGRIRTYLVRLLLSRANTTEELKDAEQFALYSVIEGGQVPAYYAVLAQTQMRLNKWKEARSNINEGLNIDKNDQECLTLLAEWADKQHDASLASQSRDRLKAIQAKPDPIEVLRKTVATAPENREARLALAQALEKAERYGEAVEVCEEALSHTPDLKELSTLRDICRVKALEQLERLGKAKIAAEKK